MSTSSQNAYAAAPPAYGQTQYSQHESSDPATSMSSYQRIMHQHTKQQFEMATASSRRRSTQSDASDRKGSVQSDSGVSA